MLKRWKRPQGQKNDRSKTIPAAIKWEISEADAESSGMIQLPNDHVLWKQFQMIHLTSKDLGLLHLVQPYLLPWLDEISEAFYASVLQVELLEEMINRHSSVAKLRLTLRKHIEEMFDGTINADYIERRMRIAAIHHRIGLDPKWYMGAFQNVQAVVSEKIMQYTINPKVAIQIVHSFNKILNLEQQLVLEFFEERRQASEKEHLREKDELHSNIKELSNQLAKLSARTNDTIHELILRGDELNCSVQQTAVSARDTQVNAEEGGQLMNQLTASIQQIDADMQQMEQYIGALEQTSKQIGTIVHSIIGIAEQTHLLSLNASIEAARAGEHGAGFAVVANEVKKLANHSKETVSNIEKLIINSTEVTNVVVQVIASVQGNTTSVRERAELTMDKFRGIVTEIDASASKLNAIQSKIQMLSDDIQSIGDSTEEVAVSAEHLNQISDRQ